MVEQDYSKKRLDLKQVFVRLIEKIDEFEENKTTEGLDRGEIVRLIQQVTRLYDKLVKLMNIVHRN